MTRVLAALFSLLVFGTAVAQPPVDYTLMCDGEVIGTASYAGGEFRAAVLEGVTCEGVLSVLEDAELTVVFVLDLDGGLIVNVGEMSGEATEVPQRALDGMVGAARHRAAAAERRGQRQETAAARRAAHQPVLPIVSEDLVLPGESEAYGQSERPVRPDLPEAARGRRP